MVMVNPNSLSSLIEKISDAPSGIEKEIAFSHLCNRIKRRFSERLRALLFAKGCGNDRELYTTVYTDSVSALYKYLVQKKFNAAIYTSEESLTKVIQAWLYTTAKHKLDDALNEKTKWESVNCIGTKLSDWTDTNEDKGNYSIEETWHRLDGAGCDPENYTLHRDLLERIERACSTMRENYAAIIRLHLLKYGAPHRPTAEERRTIMAEFNINNDEDYNTAKSRAFQQLRENLDADEE